jgi:hypothetical protein
MLKFANIVSMNSGDNRGRVRSVGGHLERGVRGVRAGDGPLPVRGAGRRARQRDGEPRGADRGAAGRGAQAPGARRTPLQRPVRVRRPAARRAARAARPPAAAADQGGRTGSDRRRKVRRIPRVPAAARLEEETHRPRGTPAPLDEDLITFFCSFAISKRQCCKM